MNIYVSGSYQELCTKTASAVNRLMGLYELPLFCPASGDTPAGLYTILADKYKSQAGKWSFVGLDEWIGMNGQDQGSCREMLDRQLFLPLNIAEEQICFFDGRAADPEEECEKTENFIRKHQGIDLAVLGLGLNGHVGMNEPGTDANSRSRVVNIDQETQQTGQKYFSSPRKIEKGITLGLGTLLEAKHLILMVSGAHKAGILKKIMEGNISTSLPATILKKHKDLRIFADKDAASLLK
jgi:glucosamine-6-phosphate isomerase